ncbi:uncharacterized protein SCHCODRAFT_02719058 [Schizophyllum commune H4-8]|uniref:Uncharacterized protein n=1 Tax=Schizophyllum commune (strain H4-8 / FGSC 9210) TaxID=578458 RepID=D8QKW8_SCHCM|nr:uncharacterized protein SCHCODRAFT_02719058 [Schizophyllum commune H4-8]KAI5885399.1 hypothetical protein SCHCODRAFT_02719058 [Schizophyllum commune H4-8]
MTAIKDADKAEEKQPLVEKDADAKDDYDASDSDGDEHRSDEESDEDTVHRQGVREERKRMEDALAEDERFTRPAVPVWKRAGLLVALGLLVWAALALREYANRPPTIIYASRYSEEFKYRPAASPIITETLRDGRLRVRGAAPTTSIKPTPTQTATSKPGRKRRGKKRSKAKKSTKPRQAGIHKLRIAFQAPIKTFLASPLLADDVTVLVYSQGLLTKISADFFPSLIAVTKMSIPPSKRHGIFCRFRSAFVRCTARSTGPNRRMASSNISAARTDTAQHAWPTRIQGALPDTAPPSVRDKSLPEIPWTRGSVEVAAPLTLQDGMQSFAQDDPKQKNSIPFPTMQAEPSSPTVTRLSLAEGLGEFNLPSHILTGLAAHVDYDSALSASPPASPPSPDAHAIGDASSPPATFRRTLAHKDGRKPLRPASSDDLDDPAPAFLDNNLENDRQHDSRPTSDFASPEAQPGTPEDQSAAQVADMPGNLTRAFVHVGKTPDDRLPGLMLRIVVGSQTAGNPLFDDALANASRACAIYGHELTQLSLTILHIQIDDGRDSLNAVLEYLQEHLRHLDQRACLCVDPVAVSARGRMYLWRSLDRLSGDKSERAARYDTVLRT